MDVEQAHGGASWAAARQATLHCLTGCAIGEVAGMVVGTVAGLSNAVTVALSIALAFAFGYALTIRSVLRAGLPVREAVRVALAADTVSIVVMEIVDNAIVLLVPGAMTAGLGSVLFWTSPAGSLAVAFVVTVPVNRALMSRGRGTPWCTPCTEQAASTAPNAADPGLRMEVGVVASRAARRAAATQRTDEAPRLAIATSSLRIEGVVAPSIARLNARRLRAA